jgi:putative cardiolipin synthase
MPRLELLLVAALPLAALGGCSSVRTLRELPRTESHALPADDSTALAGLLREVAPPEGSSFLVLDRGDDAFDVRLALATAADRSIDVQYYLWHEDVTGSLLLERLLEAADRGVRVRFLIDDLQLEGGDVGALALDRHPDFELRVFNPILDRSALGVWWDLATDLSRLDHRMHNKQFVVDGQVAVTGGRNVGDEYFGLGEEFDFRDLELLAVGPIVDELESSFDAFWNSPFSVPIEALVHPDEDVHAHEHRRELLRSRHAGDPRIVRRHALERADWLDVLRPVLERLVPGEARVVRDEIHVADGQAPTQMAEAIAELELDPEREMLLVTAYLVPDEGMLERIRAHTEQGVRVRILTNSLETTNQPMVHAAYQEWRPRLIRAGVELHELRGDAWHRTHYQSPGSAAERLGLHAKSSVFGESTVVIGTMNLDPRSEVLNTEMGLVVESPQLAEQVRRALLRDFDSRNSWRVTLDEQGALRWSCCHTETATQPSGGLGRRLKVFFLSLLPLEGEV